MMTTFIATISLLTAGLPIGSVEHWANSEKRVTSESLRDKVVFLSYVTGEC